MAKENNKDRILKLLKDNMTRQTAEEIATQLDIQRNTASGILNDLVREGIVQKEKTRPVMFSYIEPEENCQMIRLLTFIGACRFYYLATRKVHSPVRTRNTKGLIEEADNGYLFLDEVHRLSPEGRETMLDTFLRRIPVDVILPDFQERTLEEKYELILFMIHQEAKTMRATFQVSSNVINRLLTFQGKGNIGTLKNIIRLSCAKAYNERTRGQEVISFNLSHLSSDSLLLGNGESIPYINETIKVSPDQDAEWKISMTEQQDVDFSEEVMNNLVREYLEKDISRSSS